MVSATISQPASRPFNRAAARAEALGKAMRRLGLSRQERRGLWAAYFVQVNVLPRRCVAVVTTCQEGHHNYVKAIQTDDPEHVLFPSARDFCGGRFDFGGACEKPTITSKHRYLYVVDLPVGRAEKRQLARATTPKQAPIAPDSIDDEGKSGHRRPRGRCK